MKAKSDKNEFDTEALIRYIRLPAEKKLKHLEELNRFLTLAMPKKNKLIWEKLKKSGW